MICLIYLMHFLKYLFYMLRACGACGAISISPVAYFHHVTISDNWRENTTFLKTWKESSMLLTYLVLFYLQLTYLTYNLGLLDGFFLGSLSVSAQQGGTWKWHENLGPTVFEPYKTSGSGVLNYTISLRRFFNYTLYFLLYLTFCPRSGHCRLMKSETGKQSYKVKNIVSLECFFLFASRFFCQIYLPDLQEFATVLCGVIVRKTYDMH